MIYIVIPIYNRLAYTVKCIDSLINQTYIDFKIIVIDHGSVDSSFTYLSTHYPNIKIIQGDSSMWWTAATNIGVTYAIENNADYVLTLNNDTIASPNYLKELINVSRRFNQLYLIGSTAINKEGEITFAGEVENWWLETSSYNHKDLKKMHSDFVTCSRFPGRGLLIPVSVFKEVGLFDEKSFPHYLADYDFTNRARKKGYSILCATKAKLLTYPEASVSNEVFAKKNLKNYFEHLFGIKGGAQLLLFYIYALRHCPWYCLPTFLFFGTIRRFVGYWLK